MIRTVTLKLSADFGWLTDEELAEIVSHALSFDNLTVTAEEGSDEVR